MNYIKILNDFRDWLLTNELPTSAIALWHTLVSLNNMSGWKETFNAPNRTVEQLTGLSEEGVRKARKILIEQGLIEYENGRKGKAGSYKILPIESMNQYVTTNESATELPNKQPNSVGQYVGQSDKNTEQPNSVGQFVGEKLDIPKHKEDDVEEEDDDKASENPHAFFQANFGIPSPFIFESISMWCDDLGDEIVLAAMKLSLKNGAQAFSYVEKVLKEWSSKKLVDLNAIRDYERQRKNKAIPFPKRISVNQTRQVLAELRKEGSNDS